MKRFHQYQTDVNSFINNTVEERCLVANDYQDAPCVHQSAPLLMPKCTPGRKVGCIGIRINVICQNRTLIWIQSESFFGSSLSIIPVISENESIRIIFILCRIRRGTQPIKCFSNIYPQYWLIGPVLGVHRISAGSFFTRSQSLFP